MKMKKFIVAALATAMTVGSVMTASAAWVQEGPSNWRYQNADGTWQAGTWFKDVSGIWYHFDANGLMQKGWFLDSDGKWYFMDYNGAMQTGLIKVDNAVYYMDESGALFLGDKTINGQTYTFGLYGTTNGTPAVGSSRTYGGNGNQSLPSGGGSSRNNTPTADPVEKVENETTDIKNNIETAINDLDGGEVVKRVVISEPKKVSDTKAKVEVKVEGNKDTSEEAVETYKEAISTVVDNILVEEDAEVTVNVPALTGSDKISKTFTKDELDSGKLDDLLELYVTPEYVKAHKNAKAQVTVNINGVDVVYEVSL